MNTLSKIAPKLSRSRGIWIRNAGLGVVFGMLPALAVAQNSPAQDLQTTTRLRATVAQPPVPELPEREGSRSKSYLILRYDEDWSFLRDPSRKSNFFDPLKFIPLNASKTSYLTLFGDERIRNVNESTRNVTAKTDSLNFTAIRTDFGADLHLTPYFRGFVEFISAEDVGTHIGTRPASFQNPFDVLQAFIEPMAKIGHAKVGVRIGRETMKWGNGTIVDPVDFPNVQVAFDAIQPYVSWGNWRVDAFVSNAVLQKTHALQDVDNPKIKFTGVYITKKYRHFNLFGLSANGSIEPFYFGYRNENGKYGFQSGIDYREDYGIRATANFGGWDLDEIALYQGGTFANRTVRAWAYFTNQGYTFRGLPLSPRLGVQADGTSGGDPKNGSSISTYQPMFASANYFCDMAFFSPSNLIDLRPNVTFHFTPKISLQAFYGFYWRQNQQDAIYATSPYRAYGTTGTVPVQGSLIGEVPQLVFVWRITPQVLFTQYASVLMPGAALKQAGGGKGDVFFVSTLGLRF
jgi:hypothetical protein